MPSRTVNVSLGPYEKASHLSQSCHHPGRVTADRVLVRLMADAAPGTSSQRRRLAWRVAVEAVILLFGAKIPREVKY
jgi:hypothetical protein